MADLATPQPSCTPVVRVQAEPFDLTAEFGALTSLGSEIGGIGCFVGMVRGTTAGRPIRALTLEHYPAMTQRALTDVARQAAIRFPLLACTVIHRIGRLEPGAPIVLVLAASPHREAALDATSFLIDWLKTEAPFWKSEEYTDDTSAWITQSETDLQAKQRWS